MRDGYGFNEGESSSSSVDLGYTNLFCIPEVTSVFFSCCDSVLGDSLQFHQEIEGPYSFDWEHGTPQHEGRGIGPPLATRGKSHEFSRVAAGTWCIFLSYGGDGHLKLGFFLRSLDSCLVMTETLGS